MTKVVHYTVYLSKDGDEYHVVTELREKHPPPGGFTLSHGYHQVVDTEGFFCATRTFSAAYLNQIRSQISEDTE